jgi:hypothetical protein
MQKVVFLLFCLLLCAANSSAQQRLLTGYLKDSLTLLPIGEGTLSNSSKNQKVRADAAGFFRLMVSPGDLLYALAPYYRYDTLRYSLLFQDTITLFLSPVDVLEAVTITTGYRRYQRDSLQRRAAFEEISGPKMNAVDRSAQKSYFGLTLNLDKLFKQKYKKRDKQEAFLEKQEQLAYVRFRFSLQMDVRFRFSPQMVAFYTGLKGETLLKFMRLYTPTYEWLRAHTLQEQVIDYLSSKLQAFRKESH